MYLTQITEDGDLAVLSGSNQYHVSDKDPKRNICKTLVRTCTNFYALNIATFNLVIDRVGFVGKYRLYEQKPPEGYLTDGAKPIDFEITENGKIVDLTDEAHSIQSQTVE